MTPEEARQEIFSMGVPSHALQVEDGWLVLVAGLLREMRKLNPQGWDGSLVSQIKQKFAELRIYFDRNLSPEEEALVSQAEYEAAHTCESCGKPGERTGRSWLIISCVECCETKRM